MGLPLFSSFEKIDEHVRTVGEVAIKDLREVAFNDFDPSDNAAQRLLIKNWLAMRQDKIREEMSKVAHDLARRTTIASEESAAAARQSAASASRTVLWTIAAFGVSVIALCYLSGSHTDT